MENLEAPVFNDPGLNSLAATVIQLMKMIQKLRRENADLKRKLEISRKLQQKPKLYPPDDDPYFGDENDGC